MTMLAVGFVIAKFLGFSAEQDTENHSHSCCVVDTGSPCPSSLFLVVSRCLGSAENPRNFAMTKPTASIVIEQPLKILVLITP